MFDLYCERVEPGLWAEPLNAATNLAFVLVALLIWRRARDSGKLTPPLWTLIALVLAFGAGSTLFHTLATRTAHLLDVLPIALFFLAYLWLYLRRVLGVGFAVSAGALAAFAVAAYFARQFPTLLNGSLTYAPALAATVWLAIAHWRAERQSSGDLLGAAGVFGVAILFRTLDNWLCPAFPTGTHFAWHLLTGTALYLATRGLIANLPAPDRKVGAGL